MVTSHDNGALDCYNYPPACPSITSTIMSQLIPITKANFDIIENIKYLMAVPLATYYPNGAINSYVVFPEYASPGQDKFEATLAFYLNNQSFHSKIEYAGGGNPENPWLYCILGNSKDGINYEGVYILKGIHEDPPMCDQYQYTGSWSKTISPFYFNISEELYATNNDETQLSGTVND